MKNNLIVSVSLAIAHLIVTVVGVRAASITDGLVSYYSFDDAAGADGWGGHPGTINGATTGVAGKVNSAYGFDGTNDDVTIPYDADFDLTPSYTVSGWFQSADNGSGSDYRTLIGKENSASDRNWWVALKVSDGSFLWKQSSSGTQKSVASSAGYLNDAWHHFVAVNDGGSATLYVDGVADGTNADFGVAATPNYPVTIGTELTGSGSKTRFWKGAIDEVGIWSRSLTSTEVATLFNNGVGYNPLAGPITKYRFQEGVSPTGSYTADSVSIRADQPTTNQDNDNEFENIIGRVGTSSMRGLFEFDLTEIETQTGGSSFTIDSVELNFVTRSRDDGSGQGAAFGTQLHVYGFDFVEGAATWNDPDGDGSELTGDTVAGGSLGTPLVSLVVDPGVAGGSTVTYGDTAAFRAAVTNALGSPDNTLRLILKRTDESGTGNNFISLRDEVFATGGARPELIVDITIVPEPSTLCLTALGLLGLMGLGRRRRR
jgi:hypothetical protein